MNQIVWLLNRAIFVFHLTHSAIIKSWTSFIFTQHLRHSIIISKLVLLVKCLPYDVTTKCWEEDLFLVMCYLLFGSHWKWQYTRWLVYDFLYFSAHIIVVPKAEKYALHQLLTLDVSIFSSSSIHHTMYLPYCKCSKHCAAKYTSDT